MKRRHLLLSASTGATTMLSGCAIDDDTPDEQSPNTEAQQSSQNAAAPETNTVKILDVDSCLAYITYDDGQVVEMEMYVEVEVDSREDFGEKISIDVFNADGEAVTTHTHEVVDKSDAFTFDVAVEASTETITVARSNGELLAEFDVADRIRHINTTAHERHLGTPPNVGFGLDITQVNSWDLYDLLADRFASASDLPDPLSGEKVDTLDDITDVMYDMNHVTISDGIMVAFLRLFIPRQDSTFTDAVENVVVAVNPITGETHWDAMVPGMTWSVDFNEQYLCIGTQSPHGPNKIIVFNMDTGARLWEKALNGVVTQVKVADEKIFALEQEDGLNPAAMDYTGLYAFDPELGREVWFLEDAEGLPTHVGDAGIISLGSDGLAKVDLDSLTEEWRVSSFNGDRFRSTPVLYDETVLSSTMTEGDEEAAGVSISDAAGTASLYAYHVDDGTLKWDLEGSYLYQDFTGNVLSAHFSLPRLMRPKHEEDAVLAMSANPNQFYFVDVASGDMQHHMADQFGTFVCFDHFIYFFDDNELKLGEYTNQFEVYDGPTVPDSAVDFEMADGYVFLFRSVGEIDFFGNTVEVYTGAPDQLGVPSCYDSIERQP